MLTQVSDSRYRICQILGIESYQSIQQTPYLLFRLSHSECGVLSKDRTEYQFYLAGSIDVMHKSSSCDLSAQRNCRTCVAQKLAPAKRSLLLFLVQFRNSITRRAQSACRTTMVSRDVLPAPARQTVTTACCLVACVMFNHNYQYHPSMQNE